MIHIILCVCFRMKILSEGSQAIACILTIVDLITTPPTMYWLTKPMNLQTTSGSSTLKQTGIHCCMYRCAKKKSPSHRVPAFSQISSRRRRA